MNSSDSITARKIHNILHTVLILAMMATLFSILGWIMFGTAGLFSALILVGVFVIWSPKISPRLVLRMYGARQISYKEAPGLNDIVGVLSRRAHLSSLPKLYYVPSRIMNAFSVGNRDDSAIAITNGIVRFLNWREIAGILGHEVGHIQNNDLWLYSIADVLSRITSLLSLFGQLLIVLYFPLLLFSQMRISLLFIVLLIFAPALSILMKLSLSRTREFDADLTAVKLTGDTLGLASALKKMEQYQRSIWDALFMLGRNVPEPSMLRTHPHTEKRIERLLSLEEGEPFMHERGENILPSHFPVVERPPRRHWFGPWH